MTLRYFPRSSAVLAGGQRKHVSRPPRELRAGCDEANDQTAAGKSKAVVVYLDIDMDATLLRRSWSIEDGVTDGQCLPPRIM